MSIYDIVNFTDSCLKCLLKYINKDSIKRSSTAIYDNVRATAYINIIFKGDKNK